MRCLGGVGTLGNSLFVRYLVISVYIRGMAYSAIRIANRILDISEEYGDALTPIQLIKLAYISHGFSLAALDRPLFFEPIEAWKYGPVVPKIYEQTKKFGRNPIMGRLDLPVLVEKVKKLPTTITDQDEALLRSVISRYGSLNGIQLSNLTHQPDTPWDHFYDPANTNPKISDEAIKQHYRGLLESE